VPRKPEDRAALEAMFASRRQRPERRRPRRTDEVTYRADEVDRTHQRVHVTRNGRDYVVLLSAADLDSLEATLELAR
jgi:prevent-host-death family protein